MLHFFLPLAQLDGSFWLPPSGSTSATSHDSTFHTILWVTGFFFVLVVTIMLTFVVRYRRRAGKPTQLAPTHNTPLEIIWTAVPLLIVMLFFYLGFRGYLFSSQAPTNAIAIDVGAKKWAFLFTYPNGGSSNNLYVPVNQPVRLTLHSDDVTHSCYIPAFRIQKNAVPGRTTEMWFQADTPGKYEVFCTQYCGNGHSQMGSNNPDPAQASWVYVLSDAEYHAKLAEMANIFVDPVTKAEIAPVIVGEKLYKQLGCAQCHSVNGVAGQGPTWKDLYGEGVTLADGSTITADVPYLEESILNPSAKIVKGFQNIMPPLPGPPNTYKAKKLGAIIAYIESLSPAHAPAPPSSTSAPATTTAP